jgi:hypothetical protein
MNFIIICFRTVKTKTKDQLAVRTIELLSTVNTALSVRGMAFLTRSLIAVKQ